jgi:hypothetical protein
MEELREARSNRPKTEVNDITINRIIVPKSSNYFISSDVAIGMIGGCILTLFVLSLIISSNV